MIWLAAYLVAGEVVGFLAGLLGIGGGMTLVPILAALFAAQALTPDHTVHLALATAMASAFFTSTSSALEHRKHGALDWSLVKLMAPGMVTGALAATFASGWIAQRTLAMTFAVIVYAAAVQLLLGKKPQGAHRFPAASVMFAISFLIGVLSGLVSAGGTFLAMPVMIYFGVTMHTAIGTGAAIVVPVTLMGTIGYMLSGWGTPNLPPYTVGFVSLPALAAIVAGSVFTAPVGARMAHKLPVSTLKRIFACLMLALATKMVVAYW
jgi:uncharacterized membrane protein YfcA